MNKQPMQIAIRNSDLEILRAKPNIKFDLGNESLLEPQSEFCLAPVEWAKTGGNKFQFNRSCKWNNYVIYLSNQIHIPFSNPPIMNISDLLGLDYNNIEDAPLLKNII